MTAETTTLTLSVGEDDDELEVPTALIDALAEADDSAPVVVGDVAMLGLAQQAHGIVHHGHGQVDPDLEAAESLAMELFEERFGRTYGEVTGHSH